MENKKIFVSYKMDGLTEAEIFKEREWLSKYIRTIMGAGVGIIDRFIESDLVFNSIINKKSQEMVKCNALTYLGGSLVILSTADFIYASQSTIGCRGCEIELAAAQAYGIPVLRDLSKRIEVDSYVIDIHENRLYVGIRDNDKKYHKLFDKPIAHDLFVDFYDLALKSIQAFNANQGLKWNEFSEEAITYE